MGVTTRPVNFSSVISRVFAAVSSKPRRSARRSVKNVKPPETSRVFAPACPEFAQHPFCARRETKPLGIDLLQLTHRQPGEERDAAGEAFGEFQLAAHRGGGDRGDFALDAHPVRDLVDAFDGDQRRIHVHGNHPDAVSREVRRHECVVDPAAGAAFGHPSCRSTRVSR
jgi:hypothetical protein